MRCTRRGSLAFYQGDLVEARHLHAEELEIRQTLGDQAGALAALESLAMIAVRSGGTALAGALSQFAARIESARKALGQAAAAEAWAIGMSMSLQAAVAYAIERDLTDVGPLTPRELEVAALVAQGLSNRQIAERLVISARTADNHLQHILNRLDLTSRVQLAAWVMGHSLGRRE